MTREDGDAVKRRRRTDALKSDALKCFEDECFEVFRPVVVGEEEGSVCEVVEEASTAGGDGGRSWSCEEEGGSY